jgi:hypothetical protein
MKTHLIFLGQPGLTCKICENNLEKIPNWKAKSQINSILKDKISEKNMYLKKKNP